MNKEEQVTLDGIPIPLTMETLLDAHAATYAYVAAALVWTDGGEVVDPQKHARRDRQEAAFRERILRVDAEKEATIERLRRNNQTFADAAVEGTDKDARIAELK